MDKRLKQISKRAKKLGWELIAAKDVVNPVMPAPIDYVLMMFGVDGGFNKLLITKGYYETAERLLTAYEPVTGPVVEIGGDHSCVFTATSCQFHNHGYAEGSEPPGPAPAGKEWRMVLCDKEDGDEN